MIDVSSWAKLSLPELELASSELIKPHADVFIPQLLHEISTWTWTTNCIDFVRMNCATNPHNQVYYRLTMCVPRASLVGNQLEYGQLTPLILLAYRRHHGRLYKTWQACQALHLVMEPHLYSALHHPLLQHTRTHPQLPELTQHMLAKTGPCSPQLARSSNIVDIDDWDRV